VGIGMQKDYGSNRMHKKLAVRDSSAPQGRREIGGRGKLSRVVRRRPLVCSGNWCIDLSIKQMQTEANIPSHLYTTRIGACVPL
jgi:hypothetical protein